MTGQVRLALGHLLCPQCGRSLLFHDRPVPPVWAGVVACTACTLAWRVEVPTIEAIVMPYPAESE